MRRPVSPEDRYASLGAFFLARGDVSPSAKKGFGSAALTIEGRIFAMLTRGRLVIKLPKARVDVLVKDGWGIRFDGNRGVEMKEWLTVDPSHETDWTGLAEEAIAFVQYREKTQINRRPCRFQKAPRVLGLESGGRRGSRPVKETENAVCDADL